MIRKNDSITYIGQWKKTIVPKINWHISRNSVYNYANSRKRNNKSIIKNTKSLNVDNWGYRSIGVHYTDGTSRYQKVKVSDSMVLRELHKKIRRLKNIFTVKWPDKLTFKTESELRECYGLIDNICKKYGREPVVLWKYAKHFPEIRLKKVRDTYYYPYL